MLAALASLGIWILDQIPYYFSNEANEANKLIILIDTNCQYRYNSYRNEKHPAFSLVPHRTARCGPRHRLQRCDGTAWRDIRCLGMPGKRTLRRGELQEHPRLLFWSMLQKLSWQLPLEGIIISL